MYERYKVDLFTHCSHLILYHLYAYTSHALDYAVQASCVLSRHNKASEQMHYV